MKRSVRLTPLLLILGLCLVTRTYGVEGPPFGKLSTDEDVMKTLENLRAKKIQTENKIAEASSYVAKRSAELDMNIINNWIEHLEKQVRISYQDHRLIVEGQKKNFEKEKKHLLRELERAEHARAQALHLIGAMSRKDQAELDKQTQRLAELTEEKERIAKEYAALAALQYQQTKKTTEEMRRVMKEREEMKQQLDQAQDLHSRALEAIAMATQEGFKPTDMPHQNVIDELGNKMRRFQGPEPSLQGTDSVNELISTKAKLEALLAELNTEGELPSDADHEEIEKELAQIEMEAVRVRDEHDNQRKDILDDIRNNGLTGYNEERIASLQTANQRVANTNKGLQEIARRSAYLKAISKVTVLIYECEQEIRVGINRNTAALSSRQEEVDKKAGQQVNPEDNSEKTNKKPFEYVDPETMYDTIHQKYLLYKDLNQFYRTKLSTAIVTGLATVNKRLPIPFPGCEIQKIVRIRDEVGLWADGIQYALRLTKKLNKGGNRSMIARFFVSFLKKIRDAFRRLLGRKIPQENNLEDDDSMTKSVELFDSQDKIDFKRHSKYISDHLDVLDASKSTSDAELIQFRYNFIFVKRAPEEIQEKALKLYQQYVYDPREEDRKNQSEAFRTALKEMEAAEKNLHTLFKKVMYHVNRSFKQREKEYQEAVEAYKKCRYNIFIHSPIFANMPGYPG